MIEKELQICKGCKYCIIQPYSEEKRDPNSSFFKLTTLTVVRINAWCHRHPPIRGYIYINPEELGCGEFVRKTEANEND